MTDAIPLLELDDVSMFFGSVIALRNVSLRVMPGEVHCLLGDNGAGKSTLIKILSGVHAPSMGEMRVNGAAVRFASPRDAVQQGIGTVYQDLATIPLMSIARNFFLGREPTRGWGPFQRLRWSEMNAIASREIAQVGIQVRSSTQAVGTLSGGERQCLAIARAVYFGAKVLILDEPTSALGVHQAGEVLRIVAQARQRGLGVILITHNVHHAYPVADVFTLLNRGRSLGTFRKSEITREKVLDMMAGGRAMAALETELAGLGPPGPEKPVGQTAL